MVAGEQDRMCGFLEVRTPEIECTSPIDRCVRGCRSIDPIYPVLYISVTLLMLLLVSSNNPLVMMAVTLFW